VHIRVATLATLLALAAGVTPSAPAQDKYTCFIGSAQSGGGDDAYFGLAGGVVVLEQTTFRPVAWFGAAKPLNGKSQYLYLLILKTPAGTGWRGGLGASFDGGSSDTGSKAKMSVKVAGKKVEVAYDFPTDPKTRAVLKSSLTVGGKEVKEGDPKVFVVDLTGEKVTYTPVKVALPADAPDVSQSKGGWGDAVQRDVERLTKESLELKKLLDGK
jgi:hypothetical protein